jgi:hypothetical protein
LPYARALSTDPDVVERVSLKLLEAEVFSHVQSFTTRRDRTLTVAREHPEPRDVRHHVGLRIGDRHIRNQLFGGPHVLERLISAAE